MVYVLDKHQNPLMPCTEKRARLLLERGRARVHRRSPFVIRLADRTVEESELQSVRVKLDPGSKATGLAVVREGGNRPRALALMEIEHRRGIHKKMQQRRNWRRMRRNKYRRYRPRRFRNRPRVKCHICGQNARSGKDWCWRHKGVRHNGEDTRGRWLSPAVKARVLSQVSWIERLCRWAPVTGISVEAVRFDTQKMEKPDIKGMEYQRGTLAGYELKQYLLYKFHHRCSYCNKKFPGPLQVEHIIPKGRDGTNRVSNLTIACGPCNQAKKNRTAVEFGHPDVQAQVGKSYKDAAAVNSARTDLCARIRRMGLPLETGSGGMTHFVRDQFRLAKTHSLDALCVGRSAYAWSEAPLLSVKRGAREVWVLFATAKGHGDRGLRRYRAPGFPRLGKDGLPMTARRWKRRFHFGTGDMVLFRGRCGRVSRLEATGGQGDRLLSRWHEAQLQPEEPEGDPRRAAGGRV